jgi:NAD(P)-dependent dehydrogenase (short-subunit alcohol dehydrogenase family)
MGSRWTQRDIPDQTGRVAIVTGSNSGIGYEAGLALAAKNAHVILAVRNAGKGEEAAFKIRKRYKGAQVTVMPLDLANLKSVRSFSETFLEKYDHLDVLINNAGVMAAPRRRTVDRFEMQFGTNHLGHFALTGLLLPALKATPNARVVTVSSFVHLSGNIHFDDLQWELGYERWGAYAQSKLANLLFAYELQRKFEKNNIQAISAACHPGYAATSLQSTGMLMDETPMAYLTFLFLQAGNWTFAQSQRMGALPTLFAATAPQVNGCDYIGPNLLGIRGYPVKMRSSGRSYSETLAVKLWGISEQLSGVAYGL